MLSDRRKNVPPITISVPPSGSRSPKSTRNTRSTRKVKLYTSPRQSLPYFPTEQQLLTSPIELAEIKFHLLQDIEELKKEIGLMNDEINDLSETMNQSDFESEAKVAELDQDYTELCQEQKRLNDKYSEFELNSTKQYIEKQKKILDDLSKKIEQNENSIVDVESETKSDDLVQAEEFYHGQNKQIRELRKEYKELKQEEDELNSELCSYFNEAAKRKNDEQIERLEREYHALRQSEMNKRQELALMKKNNAMKTKKMRDTISQRSLRENEIKERKAFNDKMKEKKRQQEEERNDEYKNKNNGFLFDSYMKGNKKLLQPDSSSLYDYEYESEPPKAQLACQSNSELEQDFVRSSSASSSSVSSVSHKNYYVQKRDYEKEDIDTQTLENDFGDEEEMYSESSTKSHSSESHSSKSQRKEKSEEEEKENVQERKKEADEEEEKKKTVDGEKEKSEKSKKSTSSSSHKSSSDEEEIILELAVNVVAENITPAQTSEENSEVSYSKSIKCDEKSQKAQLDLEKSPSKLIHVEEKSEHSKSSHKSKNQLTLTNPTDDNIAPEEKSEHSKSSHTSKDKIASNHPEENKATSEEKSEKSKSSHKSEHSKSSHNSKSADKKPPSSPSGDKDSDIISDSPQQEEPPLNSLLSNITDKVTE